MTDIDLEHYNYQEAAGLRNQGWTVNPPLDRRPCPGPRCLTMTPGGRLCRYCVRSAAIARAALTLVAGAICGGAAFEWKREPAGDRWCFGCRRRLPHDWVLRNDTPPNEPSWYEPIWTLECSECHKDRTELGS